MSAATPRPVDVVVVGDANPDLILAGGDVVPRFGQAETLVDRADLTLGGSGAIVAAGLARLGVPTAMVAVVGDDPLGRLVTDQLAQAGVDTAGVVVDPDVSTGISVHLVDGDDRAIVTHLGSIAALERGHVDAALAALAPRGRFRHLHLASVFLLRRLRPHMAALLADTRSGGATTSLDTNWDPEERWDVADLVAHCDVLLPNEAEVAAMTGLADPGPATDRLAEVVPTVVVKGGRAGGAVVDHGARHGVAAPELDVVDAIGAGDSFDAGYLLGLVDERPAADALALAVACGSLSTRAAGGTAAQATREEAEALARTLRRSP